MTDSREPSLAFHKLVATGNDFVFIDARTGLPAVFASIPRSELTRSLCDRHFGIGADGVVFIENGSSAERIKWDFYNSDGSTAEMCGNATRCAGRWVQAVIGKSGIELETVAGVVKMRVVGEQIESELSFVRAERKQLTFDVDGQTKTAYLVNTGVPHAVFEIAKIENHATSEKVIKALRFHADAGPRGANVTFLEIAGNGLFKTVTFERGVEGFTLSCGTGVLAAAAVGLAKQGGSEATLTTPGGELLVKYGPNFSGVTLTGPAKLVFSSTVSPEFFGSEEKV